MTTKAKLLFVIITCLFLLCFADQTISNQFCGDINNSGEQIDITDVVYLVSWLFRGGPTPEFIENADCNGNGTVDISDLTCFIDYMFRYGPPPNCPFVSHSDSSGSCLNMWSSPSEKNRSSSGCLDSLLRSTSDSSMSIEFIGHDLHIYHNNAYYQCCLEYEVNFQFSNEPGRTYITATETDIGDYCYCMCYFNLESVIPNIYPDELTEYIVTLIGIEGDTVGIDSTWMGPNGHMYCEVEGNNIQMYHDNAYLNCCPAYYVRYEIEGHNITAYECDSLYGCDCLCYFNLKSTLHNIPTGVYIVTLIGGEITPAFGDTIGVDTVQVGVLGGPCSYREFPGTATITAVYPAEHGCLDPVVVQFDFVPDDPLAPVFYYFSNWPDNGQNLTVGDGKHPNAEWAGLQGLTVGSVHPCIRMEIIEGTCTPVIFNLTDVNYGSYSDYCY